MHSQKRAQVKAVLFFRDTGEEKPPTCQRSDSYHRMEEYNSHYDIYQVISYTPILNSKVQQPELHLQ